MVLSLGGTTFNSVLIQIDQIAADPAVASQLDAKVTQLQQQLARNALMPGKGPDGSTVVFAASPFSVCAAVIKASTGITNNLLSFYEEASLAQMATSTIRLETEEWVALAGLPLACGGEALLHAVSAMAANKPIAARPNGVPANWPQVPDKNNKSYKFVDPRNPQYNYVRVRTDGTIIQVKNGHALDVNGNEVAMFSPEAHYPESQFIFRP